MSTECNSGIAKILSEIGNPVFECTREKTPTTKFSLLDTSEESKKSQQQRVLKGIESDRPFMYGIRTDGLVVVDVDNKVEKDGMPVREKVRKLSDFLDFDLYETFHVETPGGGLHFYFRTEVDGTCHGTNCFECKGIPHVDLRSGSSSYVIGPGSRNCEYEYECEDESKRILQAPKALLPFATKKKVSEITGVLNSGDLTIAPAETWSALPPVSEKTFFLIESALRFISSNVDRDDWWPMIGYLRSTRHQDAARLAHYWSACIPDFEGRLVPGNPRFNRKELVRQWKSTEAIGQKFDSLFKAAGDGGWNQEKAEKLWRKYEAGLPELTPEKIEWCGDWEKYTRALSDEYVDYVAVLSDLNDIGGLNDYLAVHGTNYDGYIRAFGCSEEAFYKGAYRFQILNAYATERNGFKTISLAECMETPEREYVVKNVLYKGDLACWFGSTGNGKTFIALEMALSVAAGHDKWNGQRVSPCGVLYIASEAPSIVQERAKAWVIRHELDPFTIGNFHIMPEQIDLMDPKGTFVEKISETIESLKDDGSNVGLIIYDTYEQSTSGNTNEQIDTTQAINTLRSVRDNHSVCQLIIHHKGRNGDHVKGSNSLDNAFDVLASVEKNGEAIEVVQRKCRFGKKDERVLVYEIESVDFGYDSDGDPREVGVAVAQRVRTMPQVENIAMALIDNHSTELLTYLREAPPENRRADRQAKKRVHLEFGKILKRDKDEDKDILEAVKTGLVARGWAEVRETVVDGKKQAPVVFITGAGESMISRGAE